MYTAMTGDYRIVVLRSESDTVRVIERSLPTEPISDEAPPLLSAPTIW